jgi:hypothetical protein
MNLNFNTGVPAAANNPSNDQNPMLENNVSNAAIWNVDHFGFKVNTGGWHNVIRMPTQLADPPKVQSPVNAGQLYTKTVNGDLELYYESSGGVVSQLTAAGITPVNAVNGVSYLPGGLLINWGSAFVGLGTTAFTFTKAFAAFKVYSIVISGQTNVSPTSNIFVIQTSITNTGFSVNNLSASIIACNYIAIGSE